MKIRRKQERTINEGKRNNLEGAVIRQVKADRTPWLSDILPSGKGGWGEACQEKAKFEAG